MVLSERTYVNHFDVYYESSAGVKNLSHQVLQLLELKLYSSIVDYKRGFRKGSGHETTTCLVLMVTFLT